MRKHVPNDPECGCIACIGTEEDILTDRLRAALELLAACESFMSGTMIRRRSGLSLQEEVRGFLLDHREYFEEATDA